MSPRRPENDQSRREEVDPEAAAYRPTPGLVLISRDAETERVGSIIIPATAQEKQQVGTVVAVHDGIVLDGGGVRQCAVFVGERVVFGKYSGTDLVINRRPYLIVRETEILVVVPPGATAEQRPHLGTGY